MAGAVPPNPLAGQQEEESTKSIINKAAVACIWCWAVGGTRGEAGGRRPRGNYRCEK